MTEDIKSGSLQEFLFVKRNLRNREEAALRARIEAAGGNWQDYLDEQYYGPGYVERRAEMRAALRNLAAPFKATFAAGQFAWNALANISETSSRLHTRINEIFRGKKVEVLPPRIKLPDTDYDAIAREAESFFEIDLQPNEYSVTDPVGTLRPAAAAVTQQRALPAPSDVSTPPAIETTELSKDEIIASVLDCAEYGFNKGDLRLILDAVRGNEEFATSLFYATVGRYAGRVADPEYALKGDEAETRAVPAEAERLAVFAATIAGINEDVLHPSYVELLNDMDAARAIGIRPSHMAYLLDTLETAIGPRLLTAQVMKVWMDTIPSGSATHTAPSQPPMTDAEVVERLVEGFEAIPVEEGGLGRPAPNNKPPKTPGNEGAT